MINKVKGTLDILPNEVSFWQDLEQALRNISRLYGYKEIRTPLLEYSELFDRSNETSDMVTKETYTFKDRGDRLNTLRPEGTAGVVRSIIENKLYVDNNPLKLFYMGPMFRYERPQKGRTRQFNQFGVECFSNSSPLVDAECIAFAYNIFDKLGLKDIRVRLNTLGDSDTIKRYSEALKEYFIKYKDELCNDCKERIEKNPLRILDCKVDGAKECVLNAPKSSEFLSDSSTSHFEKVKELLDAQGIPYEVDQNLVRGLDYYTETVFEIETNNDSLGTAKTVCAGGRYNNLVKELDGPDLGSFGFAFGMERIIALLKEIYPLDDEETTHFYLISLGDKAKTKAFEIINNLRMNGIIAKTDITNKSLKQQFKETEKVNAMFTGVLGDIEIEKGKIIIKNQETKEEETVDIDELLDVLVSKLTHHHHHCHCEECDHE